MALIKQYVNLPRGVTAHEGNRRNISIAPNTVPNVGLADRVIWAVQGQPGNQDITFVNPAHRNADASAGAKLRRQQTAVSGGKFSNRLEFSQIGGEKFKLKVTKKNSPGDNVELPDTFETWRKLFYTLYFMGNGQRDLFNSLEPDFKAAFAAGFVELQNTAKIATLTQLAKTDVTNRWDAVNGRADMRFMAGAPNGVMDLRPNGTAALVSKPWHVAILVVPNLYTTANHRRTTPATRALVGTTQFRFIRLLNFPAGPTSHLQRARVIWGANTTDVRNLVNCTKYSPHSRVNWNLTTVPGLTAWLAGNVARTFLLDFTAIEEQTFLGYSWFNFCVVQSADGLTDCLQTFTHEVGHGVGQSVRWERRWNQAGASMASLLNPNWHTNEYGGQGPHCTTAAALTTSNLPNGNTIGQVYAHDGTANKLCTMFYRADTDGAGVTRVEPKGKFCPVCEPRLRRAGLNRTTMRTRRWNMFG